MTNLQDLNQTLIDICKEHGKAKDILKKANGKRNYVEIATTLKIHPTTCSKILSKARTFGLLEKVNGFYKKTSEFRHINIDKVLKGKSLSLPEERPLRVKKRKKVIRTNEIKDKITDYLLYNFKKIQHPFSSKSYHKIKDDDLRNALAKLFEYVEKDVGLDQLEGLDLRFYESFATYFSADRIRKIELINVFSNMVKCFEPYAKKVAIIKTANHAFAKNSLDQNIISTVVSFNSKIKENSPDYWKDKPIHEASIRVIYPYRHMEAHEARDYTVFDIERVVYYLFASIIFINLDY